MQNLRYKVVFTICALFIGVQTALAVNASEHYTYYTRQFLGNLGVRNPAAVPVRKINRNDPLYGAAGYADGHAIHLNEDTFAGNSEAGNLFTCAHEAAHFALGHPYQVYRDTLEIEQEADETAARMLCTHGYRWIVEEEVRSGRIEDNDHPTNRQRRQYLSVILAAHGYNPGRERNPGRQQAGRERNGGAARNAGRGRNNNAGGARGRNGAGTANTGRGGNQGLARNPGRDQNADRGRNNIPDRPVSERSGSIELKNLFNQFNDLTRTQKMVIAGVLIVSFMRR